MGKSEKQAIGQSCFVLLRQQLLCSVTLLDLGSIMHWANKLYSCFKLQTQ